MATVAVNEFVRRQVKGSGKTYAQNCTFEEIADHALLRMEGGHFRKGYRKGVRIVEAANDFARHFICPFVKIDESTQLKVEWIRRRPEEEHYIQTRALNGEQAKTGKVEFILYHHDVLAENEEYSTKADWELISIHALPEGIDELPMGPVTMMRNQLGLSGGTKAHYSAEEWAEAVRFWQEYAALDDEE